MVTFTLIGAAAAPVIPALVGVDKAVNATAPLFEGFHVQVTEKLEPDPVANLFLQPEIITLAALKVTRDATVTLAEIVAVDLNVTGEETVNELKDDVSTTSVTVIVID